MKIRKRDLNKFPQEEVKETKFPIKKDKDKALKSRLQTLINDRGLTMHEFLERVRLSAQYWYFLSWGIWETPPAIKRRICEVLQTDSSIIWLEKEDDK